MHSFKHASPVLSCECELLQACHSSNTDTVLPLYCCRVMERYPGNGRVMKVRPLYIMQ
jgi:hypothetical protein